MKSRPVLTGILLFGSAFFFGCSDNKPNPPTASAPASAPAGRGTVATSSLPAEGFKAVITAEKTPTALKPGETQTLQVKVKNASSVSWPSRGQADPKYFIKLGGRWFDANDKAPKKDDARVQLPDDLAAGAEVEVPLRITAPTAAGDYVLEIDMVQELVAWFRDKGSEPLRIKVKVQ